jgi:hypothetical protein
VRFALLRGSLAVDVLSVADAVEKNLIPLDIIADAIVAHPNSPLPDRDIGELAALLGGFLEAPLTPQARADA